jgi:hypothetical protein
MGFTTESVEDILLPMAQTGSEATGSMATTRRFRS